MKGSDFWTTYWEVRGELKALEKVHERGPLSTADHERTMKAIQDFGVVLKELLARRGKKPRLSN